MLRTPDWHSRGPTVNYFGNLNIKRWMENFPYRTVGSPIHVLTHGVGGGATFHSVNELSGRFSKRKGNWADLQWGEGSQTRGDNNLCRKKRRRSLIRSSFSMGSLLTKSSICGALCICVSGGSSTDRLTALALDQHRRSFSNNRGA